MRLRLANSRGSGPGGRQSGLASLCECTVAGVAPRPTAKAAMARAVLPSYRAVLLGSGGLVSICLPRARELAGCCHGG